MLKGIVLCVLGVAVLTANAVNTCTANGADGVCIDTGDCSNRGGQSTAGKCPYDPWNVRCCTGIPCGNGGVCMQAGSCSGSTRSGLCPGPSNYVCCENGGGPTGGYDHGSAVVYAKTYWDNPNHKCGSYSSCTPWSYWGGDACGYPSQGGDCANFVSQCLLAGGHQSLTADPCRGYPCGREEIGAYRLGVCLANNYGWRRVCGYRQAPPSGVQPGDVLIYHSGSCDSSSAHATLVTKVSGGSAYITCHSSPQLDRDYDYLAGSHPYYEWLLHN